MLAGSAQVRIILAVLVGIAIYAGGTAIQPESAMAAQCDGTDACTGIDLSLVGANSCDGEYACTNASGPIGDNSCIGDYSCYEAAGPVGDNSCDGEEACSYLGGEENGGSGSGQIGDRSCIGGSSCYGAGYGDGVSGSAVIGNDSCTGAQACYYVGYGESSVSSGSAVIGNNSCNGGYACYTGSSGELEVGDDSCNIYSACYEAGSGGSAAIGSDSCNGYNTCYDLGYQGTAEVGEASCNYDDALMPACYLAGANGGEANIGNHSCNNAQACYYAGAEGDATIGDGSCNGYQGCLEFGYQGLTGSIGNVSCNNELACAGGYGDIGSGSCNGIEACDGGDRPDCTENDNVPPGCRVEVTKTANPTSIPETGDTPVTYTVRIEFLEDEDLNWIEDDQYAGLDAATHCRVNGGAMPTLPATFIIDDVIICTYTYEPPPGEAGETHDNVFTANVGHPECPEVEPEPDSVGPADHECEVTGGIAAIFPGEVPGTNDVTADASVLYLEVLEPEPTPETRRDPVRPQPPNIGAGLSGLFNGMPTPLPTAPSAVAPAATTIRPPNTGDGGVADDGGVDRGFILGAAAILGFTGIAIARRRRA